MGTSYFTRREWWWEREWRFLGDLSYDSVDVVALLVPETGHLAFDRELKALFHRRGWPEPLSFNYLDRFGVRSEMIAALAGVRNTDVGPFPG